MKLNEYLADFNLFADLAAAHPELPIAQPLAMDFMLETGYGEREMFSSILSAPHATIIQVIAAKYADRWTALVQRQAQLQNVNERRELTETKSKTEDTTRSETDTSQVSAFNSPSLVDNAGNTSSGSVGVDAAETRTLTDTKIDAKSAFSMLNVPVQDTILSTVVSDVSSFLTLSTY